MIGKRTDLRVVEGEKTAARAPAVSYEDIGGLEREVERVREIVELPLKYPRIFERLGILGAEGRPAIRSPRHGQDVACARSSG